MTQDEIIRMARETGFHIENWSFGERVSVYESGKTIDITNELKDFAALVAAHEREKQETVINWAKEQQQWDKVSGAVAWHLIDRHAEDWAETSTMMDAWLRVNVEAAVLAEREACAKLAENWDFNVQGLVKAIRARSEK